MNYLISANVSLFLHTLEHAFVAVIQVVTPGNSSIGTVFQLDSESIRLLIGRNMSALTDTL